MLEDSIDPLVTVELETQIDVVGNLVLQGYVTFSRVSRQCSASLSIHPQERFWNIWIKRTS